MKLTKLIDVPIGNVVLFNDGVIAILVSVVDGGSLAPVSFIGLETEKGFQFFYLFNRKSSVMNLGKL